MDDRIEILDWDTRHWGVLTGRALLPARDRFQLAAIGADARRRSVELVYLSIPATDLDLANHAAEQPGLRLVDIRLVLSRATDGDVPAGPPVRPARTADVGALQDLAGAAHTNTRFFADPRLAPSKATELYRRWIVQCLDRAEDVAVAELDGRIAGYVTVAVVDAAGRIGLLAVDPSARGKGLGEALVRWAIGRAAARRCDRIVVGTQGGSPVAQRLYQRCGFTTESVDLLYHWWLDGLSTDRPGPTG